MFPYLEKNLALSIISAMELLSFSGMTETESQSTRAFINDCTEITLSNDIKEKTIEIRKKYRAKLTSSSRQIDFSSSRRQKWLEIHL
jgi:hypothetical protein